MSAEAQTFLIVLQSEVLSRSSGNDGTAADFRENVFTEYVTEILAGEVGIVDGPVVCHFSGEINRGQAKINGYALADEGQDQDTIDLFVSVYKGFEQLTKVPTDEMRRAAEQALRFFNGALGDLYKKLDPAQARYGMAERISTAASHLKRARLFILTDGLTDLASEKPKQVAITLKDSAIDLRIEFWDIERLSRALAYGRPHGEIEIDLVELNGSALPCVTAPVDDPEYAAYVTIIPGTLLFRIYDEHGPRLLERNVRSFLQARGKVNRGIRDTLKQNSGRFLAYNNGISLTAESVSIVALDGGMLGISHIQGLQIVNGGQTTASIHRAKKVDKMDLSKVFVQAKLTVLKSDLLDTLAPRIAEFANTQNPIQMADFSANDPFHIEIERLSKLIWTPDQQGQWFYERARGQYFVTLAREGTTEALARKFKERTPSHRRFTKLDLAKYINAWDQLPNEVSLGGQKNFVQLTQRMRETKPKSWKPDDTYFKELIAKAIIFNETTRIIRTGSYSDLRSQITAYTVAALSFRIGSHLDLLYVWQNQRVSGDLENMIADWARQVFEGLLSSAMERGLRNYPEWCKKADCWKAIQRLPLNFPPTLPPELGRIQRTGGAWGGASTETRVAIDPDDLDAYRQCRLIDAADWIRIIDWGMKTGNLDQHQREVATEIASIAAGGWAKDIGPKRAREGRAVINLAVENSALQELGSN